MSLATINNDFYEELGERWYHDDEHIIALLKAETEKKVEYVLKSFEAHGIKPGAKVLDVGCGAGFIANRLAGLGFRVTGIDRSESSLRVARSHAPAGGLVSYQTADAYALPFAAETFDAVLMLDFLEHVEQPARVISGASRVLRPGGMVAFYTFNRNFLAGLLAIRAVSFVAKDCPKDFHVLSMFIKPQELTRMLESAGLQAGPMLGMRPKFWNKGFWATVFRRRVHPGFAFQFTGNLHLGYLGSARKPEDRPQLGEDGPRREALTSSP